MQFASLRCAPFRRAVSRRALTLAALLFLAACGGDGTSTPATPVPTTVNITSGVIALDRIGATTTVVASVLDQNDEVIPGAAVSYASNNTGVVTVTSGGLVTAVGDGVASISVTSGAASAETTANVTVAILEVGQPVDGLNGPPTGARLFTVDVGAGESAGRLLEIGTKGGTGDVDVFVRFGSAPAGTNFDCASVATANGEACTFANPQVGTWFIVIQGFAEGPGFADVTLLARVVEPTPIGLGTNVPGLSGQRDAALYFTFDVPTPASSPPAVEAAPTNRLVLGTKPLDGISRGRLSRAPTPRAESDGPQLNDIPTLNIALSGGLGDADLIATATQPISRTPAETIECFPFEDGNEEACSITNPTPGTWIGAVFGFLDFSGVDLSVGFQASGDAGTLTLQKEVQSSSGGLPDNPATPSLSGFEFEVRPAGGGAVVATLSTNTTGGAQVVLPSGDYDVTESNALGLTDVTSAANSVSVAAGGVATVNWVNRQAPLIVGSQPPVAVLNVSPPVVPAGDNNQTSVRLYAGNSSDANGDPLTYQWSATGGTFVGSQTEEFARMTFAGGTTQTVTLTVSDGESQDVEQVQVTGTGALPPAGNFNIELVPIVPITDPDVQTAFDLAEATWEAIIRDDLPDVVVDRPANSCFEKGPAFNGTIDDVRIYIEIAPDDGPGMTLGSAGPCFIRTSPEVMPIIGLMSFDSDDFGVLSAEAINRVILHEMAHVLGFGTLWEFGSNNLLINESCPGQNCDSTDPPGPDTRFIGPFGSGAYRALGGANDAFVPIENGDSRPAGPGNRDGHWRESVFGRELMTGFLTTNVTNPLSFLTLGALRDQGYDLLDYSQVDDYSLPGPAAVQGAEPAEVLHFGDDILRGPIWAIDADGKVFLWRENR